jgi:hypothetical protein
MGQGLLDDASIPDNEINRALGFIYDSIFASTNYPERIQDAMAKDLAKSIKAYSSRTVLKHVLKEALKTAEVNIRVVDIKSAKDAILDKMQKKYAGSITIEREEMNLLSDDDPFAWEKLEGFVIKKS